ncbi:hypothetical protein [Pseudarthrobacter sp. MEB009]|uniref:hypothetical protein n=1 Tax=Pseudarthrobacter sp. MEB009 TaxID=3040326 RepID=UPI002555FA95|nr:hypothetical protein [Pseudarthrobacter sp. MEB009]
MTEPTATHPAADFELEDWLQDAAMPEESAEVYKRANVVGKLSRLRRQIELERAASAGSEKTSAQASTLGPLEAEYEKLVQAFASSQITVYVRALSSDEKFVLRRDSDERTKDKTQLEQNKHHGFALLAASIIAVEPFEKPRTAVNWSIAQVKALESKIGPAQMEHILNAYSVAQNKLPEVDADFLHKPSGEVTGQG